MSEHIPSSPGEIRRFAAIQAFAGRLQRHEEDARHAVSEAALKFEGSPAEIVIPRAYVPQLREGLFNGQPRPTVVFIQPGNANGAEIFQVGGHPLGVDLPLWRQKQGLSNQAVEVDQTGRIYAIPRLDENGKIVGIIRIAQTPGTQSFDASLRQN